MNSSSFLSLLQALISLAVNGQPGNQVLALESREKPRPWLTCLACLSVLLWWPAKDISLVLEGRQQRTCRALDLCHHFGAVGFLLPLHSVTSVVQSLIVISFGCPGSIIFTIFISDEETGLLRGQVTCLRPHCGIAGLQVVLPTENSLLFLPDHVLSALLPIGLQRHLFLVTSS